VRHIRLHTGDKPVKPHTCDQCMKSFYQSSVLARHIKVHTGDLNIRNNALDRSRLAGTQKHTFESKTVQS
jgi:uncharacterized Zn-finger protein